MSIHEFPFRNTSAVACLVLALTSSAAHAQETASADDLAQCEATLDLGYVQNDTLATVEGMIHTTACAAANGAYTLTVSTKQADGEVHFQELTGTWQGSDTSPFKLKTSIAIGANVDLSRVYLRRLSCNCASSEPAKVVASMPPPTVNINMKVVPAQPAAPLIDGLGYSKIEQIVTTAQRPMYCNNTPPIGSRIPRGTRCYTPQSSTERNVQDQLTKQMLDETMEYYKKQQQDIIECEANRGHASAGPRVAGCL